jgi:hypothetical protein
VAKPVPPSAATAARVRPVPPSAGRLGLPAVLVKADAAVPGMASDPEQCRVCQTFVYEAEDSEAFCRIRLCPFRSRKRRYVDK